MLTKGSHIAALAQFELVSAMETSLVKELISDDEGAFSERFILRTAARNYSTVAVGKSGCGRRNSRLGCLALGGRQGVGTDAVRVNR